jgi:hypothetical protein
MDAVECGDDVRDDSGERFRPGLSGVMDSETWKGLSGSTRGSRDDSEDPTKKLSSEGGNGVGA